MRITERAIYACKGNNRLMGELMILFNRTQNTIEAWMNPDVRDIRLTTPSCVKLIEKHTGLKEADILEEETIVQ
jgi:hypothetical protein